MKTNVRSLLVLTAALAASAFTSACVAPKAKQAFSHPVGAVERFDQRRVVRGAEKYQVLRSLGEPHHHLSADVWAYNNFNGGTDQPWNDDFSTLVITFTDGRVSDLKLVNERAVNVIAARLLTRSSDYLQVAAKRGSASPSILSLPPGVTNEGLLSDPRP